MQKMLVVTAIELSGMQALDPVNVYWENFESGRGRVTITCYGEAWTAYWGATGKQQLQDFFLSADDEYLSDRLQGAQFQKRTPGHKTYLKRIIRAVKESLKETPPCSPE